MPGPERRDTPRAWVLIDAPTVPSEWERRARRVSLVALLPDEVDALLQSHELRPAVTPAEAEFLGLVAAGHPGSYIARRLRVSERSVFRRLARWREHFGVDSTAELAAELARRGF